MVLHLLGKKSWNVYNTDNVERVKRDEAAAAAREEERERLMQEQDSLRRTALLRREDPPTFAPLSPSPSPSDAKPPRRDDGIATSTDRKHRRRLRDEDETSYAIRMAKLDANAADTARAALSKHNHKAIHDGKDAAPIVDHAGHIQLFAPPDEVAIRKQQIDHEKETRKKEREMRAQGFQDNLRMANASGYNNKPSTAPWYTKQSSERQTNSAAQPHEQEVATEEVETKDVWGRPDPRRKERDAARISSNDPFTFMQQAQKQLGQVERERAAWRANKERETKELEKMQKEARRAEREKRRRSDRHDRHSSSRHPRHSRHDGDDDEREDEKSSGSRRRESLDNFSLDTVPPPPAVPERQNGLGESHRRSHGYDNDHHNRHRKDYRERQDREEHRSRSRSQSPRRRERHHHHHHHHRRRSSRPS